VSVPSIPRIDTQLLSWPREVAALLGSSIVQMSTVWWRALSQLFSAISAPLVNNKGIVYVDGDTLATNPDITMDPALRRIVITNANNAISGITVMDSGGNITASVRSGYIDSKVQMLTPQFIAYDGTNTRFGVGSPAFPVTLTTATLTDFSVAGGIVYAYTAVSDGRLKIRGEAFPYGLDAVRQLAENNGYYQWNERARKRHQALFKEAGHLTEKNMLGFIAQDVQAAIPEAVDTTEDGYLNYDRTYIMHALVNAVDELARRVDDLQQN
jgi:hypothetical protein